MAPEVAGELRRRTVEVAGGGVLAKGQSADIDRFALAALAPYRLLVVRRSPAASRPPSAFRRVWRGRLGLRSGSASGGRPAVARLGLGTDVDPTAVPVCADVRRLAQLAGTGGTVRAAVSAAPAVAGFDTASVPAGWRVLGGGSAGSRRSWHRDRARHRRRARGGPLRGLGRRSVFRGGAQATVDGVRTGRLRHQLSYPGNWVPFSTADLSAGPHAVTVRLDGGGDSVPVCTASRATRSGRWHVGRLAPAAGSSSGRQAVAGVCAGAASTGSRRRADSGQVVQITYGVTVMRSPGLASVLVITPVTVNTVDQAWVRRDDLDAGLLASVAVS